MNNLEKASTSLGLTVNLYKTKVTIFKKDGHISVGGKWFYNGSYDYEDYASKAKGEKGLNEDNVVSRKPRYHFIFFSFWMHKLKL